MLYKNELEKMGAEIIRGDEQFSLFTVGGKFFSVTLDFGGFNVYRAIKDGSDYKLLPGSKFGKSFRTVKTFVLARI